ncbi:AMP-dependent synthetase/ligase [Mycobacterium paraintracellulare]|uniref:AMP-dependent synthetase/ligase n=1 Tax=Mycobacterium paraintracellulare TaxID=1138383 RepID=UPI00192808D0|nr:AMP-dependent synthetase/ligase [Mycobacterium paraintracellulare]
MSAATVCAAFQATVAAFADRPALKSHGAPTAITWAEYGARVKTIAAGLAALGLRPGETLAIQLTNRPEFHLVDMAAMHLGAIPFSVYNTSPPGQIAHRLRTAESRIIVTERAFLDAVRAAAKEYGGISHIVVVDGPADQAVDLASVEALAAHENSRFEQRWHAITSSDVATLIFTSGTTGEPKAVELSHGGIMGTLRSLDQRIPLPKQSMVSFLPMAHIGERMWTHYMPLAYGATSICCPDREAIFDCIRAARPDSPFMVPRLWEKLKAAVLARIDAIDDKSRRDALHDAIRIGLHRIQLEQNGEVVSPELAEADSAAKKIMFDEILIPFGLDRTAVAFMGGAPCPRDLVEFFQALGVPVREGYGLTESTGFAAVFPGIDHYRNGTVGRPVPGVELKLDDDGVIMLRSEMNMVGYRNQPEMTAEAFDAEGFLKTGDLGEIDADGFVKVIGRQKELIINSYGKNMSPILIEEAIAQQSELINVVAAVGDGRPYNVALITLNQQAAQDYARRFGPVGDIAELVSNAAVLSGVDAAVARANAKLSRTEQVKAFKLIADEWSPESDELTPTMKLRRPVIMQKYLADIESLYAAGAALQRERVGASSDES